MRWRYVHVQNLRIIIGNVDSDTIILWFKLIWTQDFYVQVEHFEVIS